MYSFKIGLLKGLKFFVLFALPVLVDKFIVSFPDFAQLSVGAVLVLAVNFLKVKYNLKVL